MGDMKKMTRKILNGTMLLAIGLVVGGFCDAPMSQASSAEMNGMTEIADAHCGAGNHLAKDKAPINDTMMPCCVEKHDNSGVVTPIVLNEKIKFQQISIIEESAFWAQLINQKTYASSSSPPEPKIFSSCASLE
jgi:hypothetical protein